jgi:hypothetical protein
MSRIFARGAALSALTVAALAASVAFAPAADAATHKISVGYSAEKESVKVGGHSDVLSITKASSQTIFASKDSGGSYYTPTKYTVKLVNNHKHVLLKTTISNWRALDAFLEVPSHSYKSDAALLKQVKKDLAKSNASAKKHYQQLFAKINTEVGLTFIAVFVYSDVAGWVAAHPDATTFEGYTLSGNSYGYSYIITGTPQNYTIALKDTKTDLGFTFNPSTKVATTTGAWVYGKFVEGNVHYSIGKNGQVSAGSSL